MGQIIAIYHTYRTWTKETLAAEKILGSLVVKNILLKSIFS